MTTALAVLMVEDSDSDAQLIVRALKKAGYDVVSERVETPAQMRSALAQRPWNVVISDYNLPQFDGRAALTLLQATGQDIPFIVVSGAIGEESAAEIMKAGAHDYVSKGRLARLIPAVERELAQAEIRQERKQTDESLRQRLAELEALHTVSAALRVAQTQNEALPILLDETLAALETDAGAILLYYPERDELRTAVARGWIQPCLLYTSPSPRD